MIHHHLTNSVLYYSTKQYIIGHGGQSGCSNNVAARYLKLALSHVALSRPDKNNLFETDAQITCGVTSNHN